MPVSRTLTDEARHRIGLIIDQELIGGQTPAISLQDLYDDPDDSVLSNSTFMADYFNQKLAERGSTLRVQVVERYYFANIILGAHSALGLVDEAKPDLPRRLFGFGRFKPAVSWEPAAVGAELESKRQWHFDDIEQQRLDEAAQAELTELTAQVESMVRARLTEVLPTAEQARHLKTILPYGKSLKKLEAWAYVCQIMGYDFPAVLVAACTATA
jgi:hypothetical protein